MKYIQKKERQNLYVLFFFSFNFLLSLLLVLTLNSLFITLLNIVDFRLSSDPGLGL